MSAHKFPAKQTCEEGIGKSHHDQQRFRMRIPLNRIHRIKSAALMNERKSKSSRRARLRSVQLHVQVEHLAADSHDLQRSVCISNDVQKAARLVEATARGSRFELDLLPLHCLQVRATGERIKGESKF